MSKQGDRYLRTLLMHGARAVLSHSGHPTKTTLFRTWARAVTARRGANIATAAISRTASRAWCGACGETTDRLSLSRPSRRRQRVTESSLLADCRAPDGTPVRPARGHAVYQPPLANYNLLNQIMTFSPEQGNPHAARKTLIDQITNAYADPLGFVAHRLERSTDRRARYRPMASVSPSGSPTSVSTDLLCDGSDVQSRSVAPDTSVTASTRRRTTGVRRPSLTFGIASMIAMRAVRLVYGSALRLPASRLLSHNRIMGVTRRHNPKRTGDRSMRCPKCRHIAYDDVTTCPSCGADLRLALDVDEMAALDSTIAEPLGPLGDFSLDDPVAPPIRTDLSSGLKPPAVDAVRTALPLFPFATEATAVATRSRSSRPLSVRRPTPEVPKLRTPPPRSAEQVGTLAFDVPLANSVPTGTTPATEEAARLLGRRAAAGVIDLLLLASINAVVVYLTLRLTGLSVAELGRLPAGPLASFLALIDLGYSVALTTLGGQTIGKMALGLRVEGRQRSRVTFVSALIRTAGYAISILPAGLGFVGLFVGRHSLHDRIAGTRVVTRE